MKTITVDELKINPITKFNKEWAVVTARKKDGSFNMCTVSWGSLGELWSKDVCTIYIKPVRFTNEFIEEDNYFTVSFFGENHKGDLAFLGTHSGRDTDKISHTNLTPVKTKNGITYEEAELTIICKKLYKGQFDDKGFNKQEKIIRTYYKNEEMHNYYVGEIISIIEK